MSRRAGADDVQALCPGPKEGEVLPSSYLPNSPATQSAGSVADCHVPSFPKYRASQEGIYDVKKFFSSPGNKTTENRSGSCRTKLLSCHHGTVGELFFAATEFWRKASVPMPTEPQVLEG